MLSQRIGWTREQEVHSEFTELKTKCNVCWNIVGSIVRMFEVTVMIPIRHCCGRCKETSASEATSTRRQIDRNPTVKAKDPGHVSSSGTNVSVTHGHSRVHEYANTSHTGHNKGFAVRTPKQPHCAKWMQHATSNLAQLQKFWDKAPGTNGTNLQMYRPMGPRYGSCEQIEGGKRRKKRDGTGSVMLWKGFFCIVGCGLW